MEFQDQDDPEDVLTLLATLTPTASTFENNFSKSEQIMVQNFVTSLVEAKIAGKIELNLTSSDRLRTR